MKETIWNGFRRIDFLFESRNAVPFFSENANANNLKKKFVRFKSRKQNGKNIFFIAITQKENCNNHFARYSIAYNNNYRGNGYN